MYFFLLILLQLRTAQGHIIIMVYTMLPIARLAGLKKGRVLNNGSHRLKPLASVQRASVRANYFRPGSAVTAVSTNLR